MRNLYLLHTSTGAAPDPDIRRRADPFDGDAAAWLRAECGVDTRELYHASPERPAPAAHPVTFRVLHGAFQPQMLRPTRRERARGWWYAHGRAPFWLLAPWLSALAFYLAVCLAMDAGNALADWVSAL